jgi:deoxyribonuclease-4
MSKIIFGPTGLGGVDEAVSNLEHFHKLGFRACEVLFVRNIYIKKDEAIEIGKVAQKLGMKLSIHAPYYVNLNSKEKEKIEASKARILKSCEIGSYLGARKVVFHPGFYSDMTSEKARVVIKEGILDILKEIKKNKWDVDICVEVMGKKNVFGSIEEVSWLVNETGCSFCIDFAHVLARYGENMFEEVKKAFPSKSWQCHFSGIEYGDKGEKNHIPTPKSEWKKLLEFMKGLDKDIVIICESPTPVEDSEIGMKIWEGIN